MKKLFARAFLAVMVILLYLPIFVLAVYSFTDSANIGAIHGFSLKNYETLFTKPDLRAMILGTLVLAIGSALVSTVLGTLGAVGVFYSGRFGNVTVGSLNQVPVVNAEVVTAFSLCILLIGVCDVDKSSFVSLLIGHVVLEAPFVYLSVVPRLKQMDNSLYEAALDLGASPAMALRRVVFPQIFPGVVSGFALAVTLSLDDYFITSYTKPATFDTISTYVVNATRGSQTEIKTALWALSTIIFVVVVLMVMMMNMNGSKNDKNQKGAGAGSEKIGSMALGAAASGAAAACCFCGGVVCAREAPVTLRVCSWEEYIDLGEWDEEDTIELENGNVIFGERPLYEEFEDWYRETYGREVRVEYSCFGTNEDLYNQLNLGDTYDLVCPSEYMIMKLMAEDRLLPYSDSFYDEDNPYNYYINNVSPFIQSTLESNEIGGESWSKYAAGYMWGITGVLYNPELVTEEEASTWAIFGNPKFYRQVTLKDNVRDSYFAALGILKADELMDDAFVHSADYRERLADVMNDVSPETIGQAQDLLNGLMDNVYSLETDSGKADMITGKIVANYQWSGDAVYAMDQADEEDFALKFAVPKESTNLWFDGWVMLKSGIDGSAERQHAAEAFVNFLSRTDNAVRNMYYIGYTSAIAGNARDDTMYEYLNWCYGAGEEDEDLMDYPVGYFFSGDNSDADYLVKTTRSQMGRQLYSQYPPEDVMSRTAIMRYFDAEANRAINRMWINVRCFDIDDVPTGVWMALLAGLLVLVGTGYRNSKRR